MPDRFEIRTELDEGFSLDPLRPWRGIRVRYRPAGTHYRFVSFLLETSEQPPLELLQSICAKHAELIK
jgi:hypothetical protein